MTITKADLSFTLAQIREHRPCESGWKKLLQGLGYPNGKYDSKRTVSIVDVARINGAADAIWCLRCLDWSDTKLRRTLLRCVVLPAARRAAQHTTDSRVSKALDSLTQWANGDNSVDLATTARTAHAAYTVRVLTYAARDAAYTALCATAAVRDIVCTAMYILFATHTAAASAYNAARKHRRHRRDTVYNAERAVQVSDIIDMYTAAAD